MNEKTFAALQDLDEEIIKSSENFTTKAEAWWNGLPYEDRLKAFHAVTSRINKGDLQDRGSYRHVLYSIFGFEYDAYIVGMDSGYLDIHNAIYTKEDIRAIENNAVENYKKSIREGDIMPSTTDRNS